MLNNSGESGHPCLVPDLRGMLSGFSPLGIMFAMGLSYMAFTMLRQVPSMPIFGRVLIGAELCQRLFLHLLRLSYGFYLSVC